MSHSSPRRSPLPLELARRLDPICDRFEDEWRAGRSPRLEDFLGEVTESERPALLGELLGLELDYRARRRESPVVADYLPRLPEHVEQVEAFFADAPASPRPAEPMNPPTPTDVKAARLHEAGGEIAPDWPERVGRYVLEGAVGAGGMGRVCARDLDLNRPLAVKVLLETHRGRPDLERRFREEAQITGQLQHPGVPPVHEIGTMPDGRPFFAMKLIQGRTLADLLDVGHVSNVPGKAEACCKRAPVELPRFIAIFEQVCQTLAYAHSRGVMHRDLKPSNIMVGAFGEVQVMDWGLAKVLSGGPTTVRSDPVWETGTIATLRTATEGLSSQAGAVLGTPAYMAPEQARGEIDLLNERCDVFGLGAILCVVLTGQPPYRGSMTNEIHVQAAGGDLADAFARLEASGADPELIQLGKACLSPQRNARPRDAGAVAQAVAAYQAGVRERLHTAEVERAAERARAAADRRARRRVLGLAAAVLLVLVGGIAGTTSGLVRANRALGAEAEQRQLADEQKDKAQKAESTTLEDYRASTDDVIEQLIGSKPVLGLQEKAYLEKTLKRWQEFATRRGDDVRSRWIRAEGQFRVAYLREKLGQIHEAIAGYGEALAIRQKLADDFPDVPEYRKDLGLTYNNMGILLAIQNQGEKAAEQYRKALAVQQKLADDFPALSTYRLDLAGSHSNLGALLAGQNQGEKAAEHYREALAIHQKLAGDFPALSTYRQHLAGIHNNLGALLATRNQGEKAAEHYRKALAIKEKLADDFHALPTYRLDLAGIHNNLGALLAARNQGEKAAEHYRKALAIRQKLADDFPALPAYRQDLAGSHYNLGLLLAGQNLGDKAAEHYRKALAIRQKLADDFPALPAYRQDLAGSHYNLGLLLAGQNLGDKAAEHYRKALAILQKLADDFPDVPDHRKGLALTHNNLGLLLANQNQGEKASEQCRKALAIQQKLADEFPDVSVYQVDLGGSYCNYGNLLRNSGKSADSLPWYDKAITTLRRIPQQDQRVATPRLFLRNSYWGRARAYDQLEKHSEAVNDWTRVIELSPPREQARYRAGRAGSRVRAGQVSEAVAEVAELRKSTTVTAAQWYDFACIYAVASSKAADKKTEYADQAMRMLRHTVQAGYKDAAHIAKDRDLDALRGRDEFKKLLDAMAKAQAKPAAEGQ